MIRAQTESINTQTAMSLVNRSPHRTLKAERGWRGKGTRTRKSSRR